MKLHLAAILLPAALLAAACNENAPPTRDSRNTGIGQTPNSPVAAGRPVADDPINIPQDARWTILCDSIATPDHVQRAAELKSELIQSTGRKDFYVIHKEGTSAIYYGFYREVRADAIPSDPAERARSQADLNWVRTLVDSRTGQPAFRGPIIMPMNGPDPDAPPEWNLANAPADMFWSLQIAAYKDVPDRKEAAVEAVREARKMGVQAYYYHGETISSVCVGLWPVSAVKNQADGSRYKGGYTDDPNKPLIVFGGSSAPPNAQSETPDPVGGGGMAKVMGIKIEILDQTLQAMINKYPHEVVNGEYHYKPLPNGQRFYDETFLVQVPHDGQTTSGTPAPADAPESLPPTPDSGAQPDPTLGALRSLGGK